MGFEFALRGRAREAERALEAACIARFGTLRPTGTTPVVRSDNGLIFQSRRFRDACRDYRLEQEFVTPYTPEQNGLIERFFRSLKEECVWQHRFQSFAEAQREIARWIEWYNTGRPHQSLGYLNPREFREQESLHTVSIPLQNGEAENGSDVTDVHSGGVRIIGRQRYADDEEPVDTAGPVQSRL